MSVRINPITNLIPEPIGPGAYSLPCLCGNGNILRLGVSHKCIFLYLFQIKIKIGQYIYLIDVIKTSHTVK